MNLNTNNKKFFFYLSIINVIFIVILLITGYFQIGLLSDDYFNFYDAINSSLTAKFTSKLPYTNHLHFRPVYYISMQVSSYMHNFLGFAYDNFVLYRIQNLILFLVIAVIAGKIILLKTDDVFLALLVSGIIMIFPNNLHNICWTAARVDLICCLFYLLTILFTFFYLERPKKLFLVLSLVSLTFSLMTKETAITVPVAVMLFAYFNYNISFLKKNKLIFIFQFSVFGLYLIYRLFFLKNDVYEAGSMYQPNPAVNIPGVLARGAISLIIPVDYLTLNLGLRNRETILLLYLLILYSSIIYLVILTIRSNAYKTLLQLIIFGLIILSPYIYIGYIRPQMILIPFVLLSIQLILLYFKNKNVKLNLNRNFALVMTVGFILIFTNWSVTVIKDWKYAYDDSVRRLEPMLNLNFDGDKPVVVIGNPSRLKQSFTFNKLTGAYNFWKHKDFTIIERINDIIQTAALDTSSLNSKLSFESAKAGEFIISVTGNTQFFTMEGFDNVKIKSGFRNEDMSVEFMDYNILDKPTKLKLNILSPDLAFYLVSSSNYIRIN